MKKFQDRHHHHRKPGNIEIDGMNIKGNQVIQRRINQSIGRPIPVIQCEEADQINAIGYCHKTQWLSQKALFKPIYHSSILTAGWRLVKDKQSVLEKMKKKRSESLISIAVLLVKIILLTAAASALFQSAMPSVCGHIWIQAWCEKVSNQG